MNSERKQEADERRVVLGVDDEDCVLRAYARLLTKSGLAVLTASNALAALEVMSREPVHLVLADYRLQRGPDGLDLLDSVARRWPKVGRVLMTALLDASLALAAKGHHRVIPKDLSWGLISSIIVREAHRER